MYKISYSKISKPRINNLNQKINLHFVESGVLK